MSQNTSAPAAGLQRRYRVRIALFLSGVVLCVILLSTLYRAINTINYLDIVESERDQWQRPSDVIQALSLGEGGVVVDLGCGSGYFALRLSPVVGSKGRVLAEDIRALPLLFLWIRSLIRNQHNISILHGDPEDPHLPAGAADAVLLANTYHELANPGLMLDHAFRSLRPGGRLVVVDHGRESAAPERHGNHHEVSPALVEQELRRQRFEIVRRDDRFIDKPDGEWWIIVAQRPVT